MHLFRRRSFGQEATAQTAEFDRIRSKIDTALTAVFTDGGKRAVLYYMSRSFSLSLEQASKDPKRLEAALTKMLGEIGWMVVKRKILEQFWNRSIEIQEMTVVKNASLQTAFGFARMLGFAFPAHGIP